MGARSQPPNHVTEQRMNVQTPKMNVERTQSARGHSVVTPYHHTRRSLDVTKQHASYHRCTTSRKSSLAVTKSKVRNKFNPSPSSSGRLFPCTLLLNSLLDTSTRPYIFTSFRRHPPASLLAGSRTCLHGFPLAHLVPGVLRKSPLARPQHISQPIAPRPGPLRKSSKFRRQREALFNPQRLRGPRPPRARRSRTITGRPHHGRSPAFSLYAPYAGDTVLVLTQAGPCLLGYSTSSAAASRTPWKDLPPHPEEAQVELDVNRAFIYYPTRPPPRDPSR